MELTFTEGKITQRFNGDYEINLVISKQQQNNIEALNELLSNEKIKEVKIGNKRKKRSLDANAYAWKLITEMANALRSNKEEVYISMLKRYGQSSVVSVIDEAVPIFIKSIKYWEEFGNGIANGKNFTHIKVFVGSSEYDTKEMAILVDGIVSEAKELNICTLTPIELQTIKEQWKM